MQTLEVYSSIECPFAYVAVYRLRQVYAPYADRVAIGWRALSLEYVNKSQTPEPTIRAELEALQQIEPDLPVQHWTRPCWEWPTTMWPAFEALACAQEQNPRAGFEMSWALRYAFFAENRNIAHRHVLLETAESIAAQTGLDMERFETDWDTGRYKDSIIREARCGWHSLNVQGSPTFVLPGGMQVYSPALAGLDFDEEELRVRSYTPPVRPPLDVFRDLLEEAAAG